MSIKNLIMEDIKIFYFIRFYFIISSFISFCTDMPDDGLRRDQNI